MKIAQIAPLTESVPPSLYGGTERVVAYLTDELCRMGHDVTLFASGDSHTAARLVPQCDRALRLGAGLTDSLAAHLLMIEQVARAAHDFDVLHFHVAPLHFPAMRRVPVPQLSTLHGRLDLPELDPLYREYAEMPVISISNAQRKPLPHAWWVETVYHGLPADEFRFTSEPDDYFAFLGRISPEKRLDRAIAIARACGRPIRVAAKVDPMDVQYFHEEIEPLLDDPLVEFIGEIGDADKNEFLGRARALLFPIDWPEPFGLVLIESLACGTPVVAFRGGSVPEMLEDGVTGFIVGDLEQAVAAAGRVDELSRESCRDAFERRFTAARMAADYVRVYERFAERPRTHRIA
jgi:glycosyltransferase involved in cell wall biosynthesis